MNKQLKKVLSASLISILFCNASLAAKYIPYEATAKPRDRISVHLQFGFSNEAKARITDGKVENESSRFLNDGLSVKKQFYNFALGLALWYPLYNHEGFHVNGVTYVDHIPGSTVQARRVDDDDVLAAVNVKTRRTNFAVGANIFKFIKENWFVEGMIASGVTRYHAHAAFIRNEDGPDGANDNTMDHPGVTSSSPFIAGEIGFGKQINDRSKAYIFANYSVARRDDPFLLIGADGDDAIAKLRIPDHWWKVGVVFSRDINL